jgi:hypothetical protein
MGKKVIGMARNVRRTARQRRWATVLSLIVVVAVGLFFVRTVLAVHKLVFELEGNAVTDGTLGSESHDWDEVYDDFNAGTLSNSGATAVSFTADGSQNATIFTGGGSKDPSDLTQWAWKDGAGGLPDKDNLQDAFAARYSLPISTACTAQPGDTTCEVLYFGSDRFDNSGDAQQGFWFFQNPVSTKYDDDGDPTTDPVDCPQKIGGGTGFCDPRTGDPATHLAGDLLIISDFSNGGTKSSISIYIWDPTVSGNLKLLQSLDAAKCGLGDDNDPFCGIVNPDNGTLTGGWSFTDKSGNHTYLQGELYEGGVNLSSLGLGNECFSSIAAESRSSTSTTATLKDFVIGQFANCSARMTTTPSATSVPPGTSVTDLATVTGAGTGNPPTPTGDVEFFLCSFAVGSTDTCDGTTGKVGTSIGTATLSGSGAVATATSSAVNTAGSPLAAGHYCFRAEWPGDDNYAALKEDGSGECFNVVVVPSTTTSAQTWLPNDSGTVSATGTNPLTGTLSFTLYDSDNCTGTILKAAETFTFSALTSPQTRTTTNSTISVSASKTVSWLVEYDSTNPSVADSSHCEKTQLIITN